jgi:tetratricopeptide (TPR) repeat protein
VARIPHNASLVNPAADKGSINVRINVSSFILLFVLLAGSVQAQVSSAASNHNLRGLELYDKGDFEESIAEYDKAILIDARFAEAYYNRANARRHKGDLDGAIVDHSKALEIDPRYVTAYINRGNILNEKGNHDGAISDYSKAIEIDPRSVLAYSNRCNSKNDKGDYDGAIADCSQAIKIDPDFAPAYYNRGNSLSFKKIQMAPSWISAKPSRSIRVTQKPTSIEAMLGWQKKILMARSPTTP